MKHFFLVIRPNIPKTDNLREEISTQSEKQGEYQAQSQILQRSFLHLKYPCLVLEEVDKGVVWYLTYKHMCVCLSPLQGTQDSENSPSKITQAWPSKRFCSLTSVLRNREKMGRTGMVGRKLLHFRGRDKVFIYNFQLCAWREVK